MASSVSVQLDTSNVGVSPGDEIRVQASETEVQVSDSESGSGGVVALPSYDTMQVSVVREPTDPQVVTIVQSPSGRASGTSGGLGATVLRVQGVTQYTFAHDYPYFPGVRLVDDTGLAVETAVRYPDENHVFLEFATPFTGTVILS